MSARALLGTFALVGVGLAAALAGVLVGTAACGTCIGVRCPELDPLEPGTFEIIRAERDELVGGVVEATDDEVSISYTRDDGSSWVVSYTVESRFPEP